MDCLRRTLSERGLSPVGIHPDNVKGGIRHDNDGKEVGACRECFSKERDHGSIKLEYGVSTGYSL